MKEKKKVFNLLAVMSLLVLSSCYSAENGVPQVDATESDTVIVLNRGVSFITRFKNEQDYLVPSGWLFENGIKNQLDNDSTNSIVGFRFYAAIKNTEEHDADSLTLVLVAVRLNENNNMKVDWISKPDGLYEFSDLCPKLCNDNYDPTISTFQKSAKADVIVPRSWYFSRKHFDNIFGLDTSIVGIRLYQEVIDNTLHIGYVPVARQGDKRVDYWPHTQKIFQDEICQNGMFCDTSSILYNAGE